MLARPMLARPVCAVVLVLGLAVGVGACDTAEGEGTAALLSPLPDLDAAIGTDPPTLDLGAYLETTGTATLRAVSLDGRTQPSVSGRTLRVVPVAEGTGRVRIEARTAQGVAASDTLTVRVTGPCPAPAPEGQADLFPLSRTWAHSYSVSAGRRPAPGTEEERTYGTAHLSVVAASRCEDDTQTFTVRERTVLTTDHRASETDAWTVVADRVTAERTYTWTVTDSTVSTDAPDLPGHRGAGLAPPPFGRDVPRFAPLSALVSGGLRLGEALPFGPVVDFTEGIGPVRYSATTLYGTAGDATLTWLMTRSNV